MRAEVENKKGRGPLHNPALRPRPVRLQVKPEAESRNGRVRMVNPGVLLRADLPLELSKVRENQRVERKRARKLLHRLAVRRDRVNLRETTAPGTIRGRFNCSGSRAGCETPWLRQRGDTFFSLSPVG